MLAVRDPRRAVEEGVAVPEADPGAQTIFTRYCGGTMQAWMRVGSPPWAKALDAKTAAVAATDPITMLRHT